MHRLRRLHGLSRRRGGRPMNTLFWVLLSTALINNVVLSQFLGLCPFLGVSKQIKTAAGMGAAVICVITLSSALTWLLYSFVLVPLGLAYLQTIVFILVIAALVQLVEMVLKRYSEGLYRALGVYLPLITTNCAVLGVAILNVDSGYNLLESTFNGFCAAAGFGLAMILFSCIRERLALVNMPKWMNGFPGALITAGLMAIAFMGFGGLIG